MHFGQTLARSMYAPWRDKYVDYAKLKQLLREDDSPPNSPTTATPTSKDPWTDEDENRYVNELLNVQLEKVHAFHRETFHRLEERSEECEKKLERIVGSGKGVAREDAAQRAENSAGPSSGIAGQVDGPDDSHSSKPSDEEKSKILKDVQAELDEITRETNELEKYSRLNYSAFLKSVKKHDRKRGESYKLRALLQVRLAALDFNKENYSPHLYRLSACYNFIRQFSEDGGAQRQSMNSTKGAKEEYVSEKYWVHEDNMLELKTMILRRLPVLVYNPQTSKVVDGSKSDPKMTSLYFDNPAFSLYSKKVDHGEASSLRLRWYGRLDEAAEIWFEKKTVTEDDTSYESKFWLKKKYVQSVVDGQYHMEKQIKKIENRAGFDSREAQDMRSAVDEVQAFIKQNHLQPVLRANYARTAFQIPGDNKLRISLDTDLTFVREDALDFDRPVRDPDTWHRTDIDNSNLDDPFSNIRKGEITRFPFALLEIKSRKNSKESEWVKDLKNSHLVKVEPKFSKFVHGVAQLFEDYVNTFPFWLSEIETDIRRDPQEAFEEEQAKRQKEINDEFAVGSLLRNTPHLSPIQPKERPVLSPVGSPKAGGLLKASPQGPSLGRKRSTLATVETPGQRQQDNIVEEIDDDETGEHTHETERPQSRFQQLLPPAMLPHRALSSKRKPLPPGVTKPDFWIKDQGPLKVEGKVWLANQRTFIKWQHVSILLASLSLGLYNAAGVENNVARALGAVYTVIAVFTGLWGYGVYIWRTTLIEKRSGKDFDAVLGPVLVCVALVVALLLNFGFQYRVAIEGGKTSSPDSTTPVNGTAYLAMHGDL